MKILQINVVNKILSTGRNVAEMNNYFEEKGNICATAYSKGPSTDPEHEFVIGSSLDVKVHALLSRLFGKQGYFSFSSTRKLLKFMDDFAPDIVVLNNLHGNYINLPMLLEYLAKKNIVTVAVLHDCWFFTGKCCHYTVDKCYRWQEDCGNCPSLKKYNVSWFFDKTPEMLSDKKRLFGKIKNLAVVGVSDWLCGEAKKAPVFENARAITRIYNWIDTDFFKPADTVALRKELGVENNKIILFAASNWTMQKGLKTAKEVSERLGENETMLVVGNLPDGFEFNDRVIVRPRTDSMEQLIEYYSLVDVFVQPSLEETFGKVIAEAEACGTPVICFNSTANPEIVGERCGERVAPGDLDGLMLAIRRVLKNGKETYSKNCRDFVIDNFNLEKSMEQYASLFEKMIKEKQ